MEAELAMPALELGVVDVGEGVGLSQTRRRPG
jgi:hypothetical protein